MEKGAIISIFGRVQGVGFRYYTQKRAQELNLKGFVRNKANGSVYIEAEGEESSLQLFVYWCKNGPDSSRVLNMDYQYCNVFGYEDFKVK